MVKDGMEKDIIKMAKLNLISKMEMEKEMNIIFMENQNLKENI